MIFLHQIGAAITGGVMAVGAFFGLTGNLQQTYSGTSSNPGVSAIFETSLAAPLSIAGTSMTLASNSIIGTQTLPNGLTCLTLDSGTNITEYVCGTVSGTTVSNLQRGISPTNGTSTVASLAFAHRRGADVKLTDFPTLTILNNQLNGIETIPNLIQYDDKVLIGVGSASTTLATKYYVDNTAVSGAPNANATTKGIVQLATALQAASSTSVGTTGANDVLWAAYATDTPQNCTTASPCVAMTAPNGFLRSTFIDKTATYLWTAFHTFSAGLTTAGFLSTASSTINATTTIAASNVLSKALVLNTVPYSFPSTRGTANTVLTENGGGTLSWSAPAINVIYNNPAVNIGTSNTGTTTLQEVTIPANTMNASNVSMTIVGHFYEPGNGACFGQIDYGNGTATSAVAFTGTATNGAYWTLNTTLYATSSASEVSAYNASLQQNAVSSNSQGLVLIPAYSFSIPTYVDFRGRCSSNGPINLLFANVQVTT